MGLGKLLLRDTQYTVKDTVSGALATYTILDNLAPQFASITDYRGGMGIPGAWRAVTLLSDLIGQVPWDGYREQPDGTCVMLRPRPALLEQPAPPDTRMTTFSSWVLDLIWHGNAIGVIAATDFDSNVTAVLPVPAQFVSARRVTPFWESPLPVGSVEYKIGAMTFGPDEVVHIKGPCAPRQERGMGVLEAHLNTLSLASEQARQARSISTHGVPTGLLKATSPDSTPTDLRAAKTQWMENQANRTIQAIGPTTEFQPLSWNPEELQMIEARKFSLTELELIFGLPNGFLGGQTSSKTYANVEQNAIDLLKYSLGGHLARFEQTLSQLMPAGDTARADLDAILRPDTLARYQSYTIGLQQGFLTVDEVRQLENRPPLPEKPAMADAYTLNGSEGMIQ